MIDGALRGHGKVVLVTGAAAGIGRATADVFGAAGYSVLVVDLDREAGAAAVGDLRERSIDAQFAAADVAASADVKAAVDRAVAQWGRLDVVVNNAGISGDMARIDALDESDLDRVLAVNLKGPFYVCKHAVPALVASGGGAIVNVASITAKTGSAYFPAYAAAKAGVIALTRSLARNLGRRNIRVNCVSPGSVEGTRFRGVRPDAVPPTDERRRTERAALLQRIPLGRTGQPCDVANAALFLASPLARHIHGAVLRIDGGEILGFQ